MKNLSKAIILISMFILAGSLLWLADSFSDKEKCLDKQAADLKDCVAQSCGQEEAGFRGLSDDSDMHMKSYCRVDGSNSSSQNIKESAGSEAKNNVNEKSLPNEKNGGSIYISSNEIAIIANNLSFSDKLTAISLAGKLNKEDINRICAMTSNGITCNEMEDIKVILGKTLSKDEISKAEELLERNKKLCCSK